MSNKTPPPYIPNLDSEIYDSLFDKNFAGVHSRETVLDAEGFWGKWVFVYENKTVKPYWQSNAAEDEFTREGIREMVAILGSLVFEMVIMI